jgi:hypothetical protein
MIMKRKNPLHYFKRVYYLVFYKTKNLAIATVFLKEELP